MMHACTLVDDRLVSEMVSIIGSLRLRDGRGGSVMTFARSLANDHRMSNVPAIAGSFALRMREVDR